MITPFSRLFNVNIMKILRGGGMSVTCLNNASASMVEASFYVTASGGFLNAEHVGEISALVKTNKVL